MLQVAEAKVEQAGADSMTNMCNDLFREWLVGLNSQEKEIWLWNASVLMYKIKKRRHS
jgi:hypothetical protein